LIDLWDNKRVKKYFTVFQTTLKDAFAYRWEGLIYFLSEFLEPLLMMVVWSTVFMTHHTVGNFDLNQMLIYYFFIFIFGTLLSVYPENISRSIRTGELNFFLVKPINVITKSLFEELSWKIVRMIFLIIGITIMLLTILHSIPIPFLNIFQPTFLAAITIGFLINFYIKVCVELLSFWFVEVGGLRTAFYVFEAFFAGFMLPLNLMPQVIANISQYLPFKYFYYFPTQIIMGTVSQKDEIFGILLGLLWLLVCYAISALIYKLGIRYYSAVSG